VIAYHYLPFYKKYFNVAFSGPEPGLEDLGDDDIALGTHFEVKTCDRFWLKTIIRLVRCRRLQDLLVFQGTTKLTRKKSQESRARN